MLLQGSFPLRAHRRLRPHELPVDLVTPASLGNPYFRQRVEEEKTLLYAA